NGARIAQGSGVTEGVVLAAAPDHPVAGLARPAAPGRRPRARLGAPGLPAGPGRRPDRPDGVGGAEDHPDAVVLLVGDVEVAVLELQVVGPVELGLERRRGAGVAGDGPPPVGDAGPADGGDVALRVDPANAGAHRLGDEDVAGGVGDDAPGPTQVGGAGRAAVTGRVALERGAAGGP